MTNKNQSVVEPSHEENSTLESKKGQFYAPLFLDDDPILPKGTNPDDIKSLYIGGKFQKAVLVPVSKKIAQEFVNEIEREKKRCQRNMMKAENGKMWGAMPLDISTEEYDVESREAAMQLDLVQLRLLFDQLVSIIEKKNPSYALILRMTREGKTQKEIAKILGKTQPAIHYQQQAALKLLRKLYQEEK